MLHRRRLNFCLLKTAMQVTKLFCTYRLKQCAWLSKNTNHDTRKRSIAKKDFGIDLYEVMDIALFGKTLENVRGIANLDFISDTQRAKLVKQQSLLGFIGIVFHYPTFDVYKFDKEKNLFDKPIKFGLIFLESNKMVLCEFC